MDDTGAVNLEELLAGTLNVSVIPKVFGENGQLLALHVRRGNEVLLHVRAYVLHLVDVTQVVGDAEILDHRDVKWNCPCNKEHYRDALSTISLKDLDEMIAEGKPIEIVCEYCGTKYTFSSDELKEIRSIACGK